MGIKQSWYLNISIMTGAFSKHKRQAFSYSIGISPDEGTGNTSFGFKFLEYVLANVFLLAVAIVITSLFKYCERNCHEVVH